MTALQRTEAAAPTTRRLEAPPRRDISDGPYVDYSRRLTADGGVMFVWKDLDLRFRLTLRRIALWIAATGCAGHYLWHAPLHYGLVKLVMLVLIGVANWYIVKKPVEVYRTLTIMPDCMILNGRDIFWQRHMEKWPSFAPKPPDGLALQGVYGTRQIEYAILRQFDEHDRTAEVFGRHLQLAMSQLWVQRN